MKPTKTQIEVMSTLYMNNAGEDGERLITYKFLEKDLGFNHRQVKGAITPLRFHKLVEHLPAVDEEGRPCGSGFKLTKEGHEMTREFPEMKKLIEEGHYD